MKKRINTTKAMAVKFLPEDHKYVSVDPQEQIPWVSVTSIISKLKQPFEAEKIAEKSSKNIVTCSPAKPLNRTEGLIINVNPLD